MHDGWLPRTLPPETPKLGLCTDVAEWVRGLVGVPSPIGGRGGGHPPGHDGGDVASVDLPQPLDAGPPAVQDGAYLYRGIKRNTQLGRRIPRNAPSVY